MKLVATIGINWMHIMRQDIDGLHWLGRRHLDRDFNKIKRLERKGLRYISTFNGNNENAYTIDGKIYRVKN